MKQSLSNVNRDANDDDCPLAKHVKSQRNQLTSLGLRRYLRRDAWEKRSLCPFNQVSKRLGNIDEISIVIRLAIHTGSLCSVDRAASLSLVVRRVCAPHLSLFNKNDRTHVPSPYDIIFWEVQIDKGPIVIRCVQMARSSWAGILTASGAGRL